VPRRRRRSRKGGPVSHPKPRPGEPVLHSCSPKRFFSRRKGENAQFVNLWRGLQRLARILPVLASDLLPENPAFPSLWRDAPKS
jgi:hypothetical protein